MSPKKQNPGGNSIIDFFITEVVINGIFRFFVWVITGIAGLFSGE